MIKGVDNSPTKFQPVGKFSFKSQNSEIKYFILEKFKN